MSSTLSVADNQPRIRPSASSQNLSNQVPPAATAPSSSSTQPSTPSKRKDRNTTSSLSPSSNLPLLLLFLLALLGLYAFYTTLPDIPTQDRDAIKFPRSLADVRSLSHVLKKYRDQHMQTVTIGFCIIYIFLQTFAIPGAIFLSILAGPLFGVYKGLFIVSAVATTGSSLCYFLSYSLGRNVVQRTFPSLIERFSKMIEKRRNNLLFYLLFLRISPLLPNWFISISSPILNIPFKYFATATFFGLMPANYLHVTTGINLGELGSAAEEGSPVNIKALLFLFGIAFLALIPTLFRKKFEAFNESGGAEDETAGTDDDNKDAEVSVSDVENNSSASPEAPADLSSTRTRSSHKKKTG